MTDTSTADLLALLDRLEAVHAAATEGPWVAPDWWRNSISSEGIYLGSMKSPADAAAIVAEHNAIPGLVAAVRAALALADELDVTFVGSSIQTQLRTALASALPDTTKD